MGDGSRMFRGLKSCTTTTFRNILSDNGHNRRIVDGCFQPGREITLERVNSYYN